MMKGNRVFMGEIEGMVDLVELEFKKDVLSW